MTFGEKLYRLRKEKGWTQERLAEQIGVSRQALSKWESGSAVPDAVNILRLSKLFAVSADYLLDDAFESSDATWAGRPSGQARRPASWAVLRTAAGVCAVSVSLLGMLLLGILSSAFPCVHSISPAGVEWTRVYTGLWGFLKTNHLEWLFALCGVLLLAGAAVLCSPVLKRLRDRRASSPAPDQ